MRRVVMVGRGLRWRAERVARVEAGRGVGWGEWVERGGVC